MGLGRLARLWSAAMAIVGGHLAGRMEHGVVGLVLSTAACSLVIPPALDWVKTGRRRSAILLGVTLAGALLSGQVYVQLALCLGVFPAFFVYARDPQRPRRRLVKGLVCAWGLALLLSGVFWVPLLHFLANFSKDLDPVFASVQPLEYLPLNLVIRDLGFYYNSQTLGRWSYPYLYVTYIGWIPVLLALLPLRLTPRAQRRQLHTLLLAIVLVYLCASAVMLKPLAMFFPEYINGIRHITVSSGLAVPLVLALAAWGLELTLRRLKAWHPLNFRLSRLRRPITIWTVLASLLLLPAVHQAYDFSQTWLYTTETPPDIYASLYTLHTESAQWVAPPFGEHFWTPPALEAGLKLTHIVGPWRWQGRNYPLPHREMVRESGYSWAYNIENVTDKIEVMKNPAHVYAAVKTMTGATACHATAMGGHIDVICDTNAAGVLTVQENNWTGWYAWQNGMRTHIARDSDWLTVHAPAGENRFTFRYRPWDVPFGLVVTCLGFVLCVLLWQYPVNALPILAALNRWADRGLVASKQLPIRAYTRLRTVTFSERHELRRSAWLLNGLASAILLAMLGLRRWSDLAPLAFIMKFLIVLFIVTALAGGLILLQYIHQREKQAQYPPESADAPPST
ncbi:MAG: hypothetical protein K8R89_01535 [Anaerolineae bacterium]|nr:hypothetical protein [Anaerolineae bacterium]